MSDEPVVRIAELTVDPAQREAFIAAVRQEMDESVRVEPGVLAIYAVAQKGAPASFRFVEIHASEAAYDAHVQSPHFRAFRATTDSMVRARTVIETVTIHLSAKTAS